MMKEEVAGERVKDMMQLSDLNEQLLNTIQDLIFIIQVIEGPTFRYMYMNEKARAHTIGAASYHGKTFEELLKPDIAHELTSMYKQAVEKKETLIIQDEMMDENGKKLRYESLLNPILDEFGVCQYVVCITRDITDRVYEQEKLLESQMRYRSLFDYNSDAILSLDISGKIAYANPATNVVFGCCIEHLRGQYVHEALPVDNPQELLMIFQKTLQGESVQLDSYRCYHQDGRERYVYLKTLPIVVHEEIKGVYIVLRDITRQVMDELKTEYYAYHDELTGLFNHISFAKQLSQRLAEKKAFSLFLLNMDEFHIVNDLMGHKGGDEVLQQTAKRLQSCLSGGDMLFRQHGDQFFLLSSVSKKEAVVQLAEKLLQSMLPCFQINGEEFSIGMSMGISICPEDGSDEQTLLKRADLALERAKEHGKGGYACYHPTLDEEREKRFILESQLNRSIERKEFTLHYQPQVNITTQEVIGLEALLRWNNERLGFVPPNYFIPLAERTGFIFKIDEWVVMEACRQLREWMDKGYEPVPVAVNISAKQFHSTKVVELIVRAMQRYQIPPSLLVIELTEGALVHEAAAEQVLCELKEHGLCIHLDDFGTGYSSLGYLKKYPIDTIKIDRAFMIGVAADERDAKITTAIIGLAQTLGMDVIAEGIEEAEQIQFLRKQHALLAQGYYFSKPLPVSEVEQFCFLKK